MRFDVLMDDVGVAVQVPNSVANLSGNGYFFFRCKPLQSQFLLQSVLSDLPGHLTRFQLGCVILEGDCRDSDRYTQGSFAYCECL